MSQKKKILYIITQGAWGGAQRYVFDLATNLSQEYEITVAVGEPNGNKDLQSKIINQPSSRAQVEGKSKIKVVALKHLVRPISPIHDILAVFELRKLYKQIKPDIVHLNSTKAGILGSLAKSKISNQPSSRFRRGHRSRRAQVERKSAIIYTVHGWVFNEPMNKLKKSLYIWLEKITAKQKDSIIVLSEQDKLAATKIGITESKLNVIPLGINPPTKILSRTEARNKLNQTTRQPDNQTTILIGTIAGLYRTKGLDVLIEAIKILNQKSPIKNQKFIIVGDGPELKNLKSQISNLKLANHIYFTGYIENASDLLFAFDIFILPSRKEGFPYVLLEAKQAGLPIIATNVGGIPSLIDDQKNGLLVEPNNPIALAEKINYLLENKTVRTRLSELPENEIAKYSLDKMVEATKQLYLSTGK